MPPLPPATVVIPAAGEGGRLPGRVRKSWRSLGGRPLLLRNLEAFQGLGFVREIVLLVHPRDLEGARRRWGRTLAGLKVSSILPGGTSRTGSVAKGVLAASPGSALILIHDAARPLVSPAEIRAVALAAQRRGAAILALPAADTLKRVSPAGRILGTLPREGVWLAQTPQGFRRDLIVPACRRWLKRAGKAPTDDAGLLEGRRRVWVVQGSRRNFKVTTAQDLALARVFWNFST